MGKKGVEGKGQKGEKGKSVQEVWSLYDTIRGYFMFRLS